MKIFFVGNFKGGFVGQDAELLSDEFEVTIFDIQKYTLSIPDVIRYGVDCLKQIMNIRRSDLIYIWMADVQAVPVMIIGKLFSKPVVVCIGDYEVNNVPEINYGNQRFLIRGMLSRWVIRNATKNIVPTEPFVGITKKVELHADVVVIPDCIDVTPCAEPFPEKKNLVTTAVLSEFSRVRKNIPLFEKIRGSGKIDAEMKVMVYVPREEYIQTLKDARVYCQLSYPDCEAFGVSLCEAMSYGCVPVISNCAAMEWVVDGTGIVVPYGDEESTINAIQKALTMDGVPARDRAGCFTKERRKKAIVHLIKEICDKQKI
jgi:glycosyltransferase involved in cell wall biosynthesis